MGTGDGPGSLSLAPLVEYLRRRTQVYSDLSSRQEWDALLAAVSEPVEQVAWARLRELLLRRTPTEHASLENLYAERLELETTLARQKASTLAALLALQKSRQLLGRTAITAGGASLGRRVDARG